MTFSLIYTAKGSGNRWYWAEPGFSRQASRKHEWPTTDAISLATLQKDFYYRLCPQGSGPICHPK